MRTSLYSKIIPWFFVSFIVLGGIFLSFFSIDFRVNAGSFLSDQKGDKMMNLAWRVSSELSMANRDERDEVLKKFGKEYDIDFYVFTPRAEQLAGKAVKLPKEVIRKIREHHKSRLRHPEPPEGMPPRGEPGHRPPPHRSGDIPDKPPGQKSDPKFSIKAESMYWVGVRVPFHREKRRPKPVIFLARSDSMTGHGLFWSPIPWIFAVGIFIVLGVLVWIPIIRHIATPVSKMTNVAEEMAKGRFEVNLDEKRTDEIGRLAKSINKMAAHLNGYLTGQRRFLADISHELTSPVARAKLALTIAEPETDGKANKRIRQALGEMENMSDLVNKLLNFSRTEISSHRIKLAPVDIKAILDAVLKTEISEDTEIKSIFDDDIVALADADLLQSALTNVIRNAVRYAGQHGLIEVIGKKRDNKVMIEVRDHGAGVPDMELDYIFEPFYRAEPSRNRNLGGVGLGLAIVKSSVEACKGTVSAQNLHPGFMVKIELEVAD